MDTLWTLGCMCSFSGALQDFLAILPIHLKSLIVGFSAALFQDTFKTTAPTPNCASKGTTLLFSLFVLLLPSAQISYRKYVSNSPRSSFTLIHTALAIYSRDHIFYIKHPDRERDAHLLFFQVLLNSVTASLGCSPQLDWNEEIEGKTLNILLSRLTTYISDRFSITITFFCIVFSFSQLEVERLEWRNQIWFWFLLISLRVDIWQFLGVLFKVKLLWIFIQYSQITEKPNSKSRFLSILFLDLIFKNMCFLIKSYIIWGFFWFVVMLHNHLLDLIRFGFSSSQLAPKSHNTRIMNFAEIRMWTEPAWVWVQHFYLSVALLCSTGQW